MQDLREANSTSRTSELERQLRDFQQREENFQRQLRDTQRREQREFTKTVQRASGTGTERSKAAYGVAAA